MRHPATRRAAVPARSEEPGAIWPAAPPQVRLKTGEVHLWLLNLRDFAGQLSRLHSLLSTHELARAARYHFPADRDAYITRHGVLRLILGRYLQQAPAAVEFRYSARGKPETTADNLHFNDSHSGDFVLYGVTAACPLGVDIEKVKPIPDFEEIAANYFSPREVETMRALAAEMRMQAFYAAWTRKEAFLKATGEGIAENLPRVEVTLKPEEQPEILAVPGDPFARAAWKLKTFRPAPGYLGAAAFRHSDLKLHAWSVPAF
jgi:4'-phosphopantetheinyl transferase